MNFARLRSVERMLETCDLVNRFAVRKFLKAIMCNCQTYNIVGKRGKHSISASSARLEGAYDLRSIACLCISACSPHFCWYWETGRILPALLFKWHQDRSCYAEQLMFAWQAATPAHPSPFESWRWRWSECYMLQLQITSSHCFLSKHHRMVGVCLAMQSTLVHHVPEAHEECVCKQSIILHLDECHTCSRPSCRLLS